MEYLYLESFNGLNLYCYCYNNSINYVDPDGHLALWALALIGVTVCGLINGVANTMTMSDDETAIGAFTGGFIEGVTTSLALAIGLSVCATGGALAIIGGGAIAISGGFIGGKYGNAASQQISYGNIDWEIANINGGFSAMTNLFAYIGLSVDNSLTNTSNNFAIRIFENVTPSCIGLGISSYFVSLPKPNLNDNRDEERIKTQKGRYIWEYLFE